MEREKKRVQKQFDDVDGGWLMLAVSSQELLQPSSDSPVLAGGQLCHVI
jgi:hypothetical protein